MFTDLCTFLVAMIRRIYASQELLKLVIIFINFMTFIFDSKCVTVIRNKIPVTLITKVKK